MSCRRRHRFYANAAAIAFAFATITYLEVLLGELVPKSLALQRSERIALAVAGPMDVFMRMTRPAVKVMNASATLVLHLFRAPLQGEGAVHSPEELKLIATATRRMGLLPTFQEEIIHRAIELSAPGGAGDHDAAGKDFFAFGKTWRSNRRVRGSSTSSIRGCRSLRAALGPDHIVGIVHSKDVSRLMHFRATALGLGWPGAGLSR